MTEALAILLIWCIPSVLLVGIVLWHRHKTHVLIRQLHLDEMFSRHQHAGYRPA